MYVGRHVDLLLFLSDFNQTWIFSTHFSKIAEYKIYENCVVGAELFRAVRLRERHAEANIYFFERV